MKDSTSTSASLLRVGQFGSIAASWRMSNVRW